MGVTKARSSSLNAGKPLDHGDVQLRVRTAERQSDYALDDNFFDFLSRCQGNRMDEQRCELPKPIEKSKSTEDMLEMVARVQGDRMNEQRSDLPDDASEKSLPRKLSKKRESTPADDDLYEMVLRSQSHRIEDQRSDPPPSAPTVPDEDFFGLILRLQSNRMDDQRSFGPGGRKAHHGPHRR